MIRAPWLFAAALLALSACTGQQLSRNFGFTRDSPDEFEVTTRAPLSMPPDYTLHPPRPGAARPQERTAQLDAEAALAPAVELNTTVAPQTPGQQALLAAAGPPAPDNIRAAIDAESARVNSNAGFSNTLMFWKATPPPGQVIDPVRESQRLHASAALGDGPIIQR